MARYRVLIDENFHFMEESHRYEHGVFEPVDEAIAVCRKIVDSNLGLYSRGMSAAALYLRHEHFSADPLWDDRPRRFDAKISAWDYGAERDHVHSKSGCRLMPRLPGRRYDMTSGPRAHIGRFPYDHPVNQFTYTRE